MLDYDPGMIGASLRIFVWCVLGSALCFSWAIEVGTPIERMGGQWVQSHETGGVTIAVKRAAMFDQHGPGLAENDEGWVERDALRVRITEPQYFAGRLLAAGEYRFGLMFGPEGYRWSGALGDVPQWVELFTDALPTVRVEWSTGAVACTIQFGEVATDLRFVPAGAHDALTAGLTEYRGSSVSVLTDVPLPGRIKTLVRLADRAVSLYSSWSRMAAPDERLYLYIFNKESDYRRMSDLLNMHTEERFAGYASFLTRRAYLRNYLLPEPEAWPAGDDVPVFFVHYLLHELNHIFYFEAAPHSIYWPIWLIEGLAESQSFRALQALGVPGRDEYEAAWAASLHRAREHVSRPHAQDFLGGNWEVNLMYPAARAFVGELVQVHEDMFVGVLRNLNLPMPASRAAELAELFVRQACGSPSAILSRVLAERTKDAPAMWQFGAVIACEHGDFCAPHQSSSAGFLHRRAEGQAIRASFEAAFLDSEHRQVDVLLAASSGDQTGSLHKLAITPNGVSLMYMRFGAWATLEHFDLPLKLATSTFEVIRWHRFEVSVQDMRVEVKTPGGKSFWFILPDWIQTESELCGVAAFRSAVLFRNVSLTVK